VEPEARLRVRATASTVAWTSEVPSRLSIRATVGPGALLDWRLQPLIAAAGCNHTQHARVSLCGSAQLRWTEELILGRHAEHPGDLEVRLDVDVDSVPLLRHGLRVGPSAPGWDGPSVLGANRACVVELRAGRGVGPAQPASGPEWAVAPLDGPGVLAVAVGLDLLAARAALGEARLGD